MKWRKKGTFCYSITIFVSSSNRYKINFSNYRTVLTFLHVNYIDIMPRAPCMWKVCTGNLSLCGVVQVILVNVALYR